MKKAILFTFAFIFTLSLQAELHYQSFGAGWSIGLNQNVVVDIDEDGDPDFFINGYNNELGFVPVFGKGCFSSPSYDAINNIGSRELTLHQTGDVLDQTLNTFDFIDNDRGSAFNANTNELALGWTHMQDQYIGFFIFGSGRFGWMKVAVDTDNKKIIIKEMAYEDQYYTAVTIGYTGQLPSTNTIATPNAFEVNPNIESPTSTISRDDLPVQSPTSTNQLEKEVTELLVAPNPASDIVNITLNYMGEENLSIIVTNSVGKEIYRNPNNILQGETSVEISVSDWSNGIYFIQLQNEKGIKTERLSINR